MSLPEADQPVIIEISSGVHAGTYQTRITQLRSSSIHTETPINITTRLPHHFERGTRIVAHYSVLDGVPCSFQSMVLGSDSSTGLIISMPSEDNIVRQQRREFVRVPFSGSVDIVYMHPETKEILRATCTIRDVSAGGMRFAIPSSFPIRKGDAIGMSFNVPMDGGQQHLIHVKGWILRLTGMIGQADRKLCSVKYFELTNADQQRLVQFAFKRQIEMKERTV